MIVIRYIILITICTQLWTTYPAEAQVVPNERIGLACDRNIYAAGEDILFRAFNTSDEVLKMAGWSQVIYLEIIDSKGVSLARGKYPFSRRGAEGNLMIPASLLSGRYFLCAYTRWMQNFPAEQYAVIPITIINPFTGEVNSEHGNEGRPDEEISDGEGNSDNEGNTGSGLVKFADNSERILIEKPLYGKREKVIVEIGVDGLPLLSEEGVCISVVPAGAGPVIERENRGVTGGSTAHGIQKKEVKIAPEIAGLSISGRVVSRENRTPISRAKVHFATFGAQSDYAGISADTAGKFVIRVPDCDGTQNLYIGTDPRQNGDTEILIENPFSHEHGLLQPVAFSLNAEEEKLAEKIMFGAQVSQAYAAPTAAGDSTGEELVRDPFYGTAPTRIEIDEYVPLPSLEEFIRELIPQIRIRDSKEGTSLLVEGRHTDIFIYPSLVLYDMVPVHDINAFLKLSPQDLQRIEVIDATYQRGDLTFGGIISVYSRKGDLGGYELPEGSWFFDFEGYGLEPIQAFPDYSGGPGDLHIPDYRNTLYWDGDLSPGPEGMIEVELYTPDRPGEYIIHMTGVTVEGQLLKYQNKFVVR